MAQMNLNTPAGLKEWIQTLGSEDAEGRADEEPDGGEPDGQAGDRPADAPDGAPDAAPEVEPQGEDLLNGFRERFGIPPGVMPTAAQLRQIRSELGAGAGFAVGNRIIDELISAVTGAGSSPDTEVLTRVDNLLKKLAKEHRSESDPDPEKTDKDKKGGKDGDAGGGGGAVQEEAIKIKTIDAPALDLRPTFNLLGTDADTETPDEAVAEQMRFAAFSHVKPGHGNGPENPLYLSMERWKNMVRFVNNFAAPTDHLSDAGVRLLEVKPGYVSRTSLLDAKRPVGTDPNFGLVDSINQPSFMRSDNLGVFNNEHPNVPVSLVHKTTTDEAEFRRENNLIYPVGGTDHRSVPRTTYASENHAAGHTMPTGQYNTADGLELRPAPEFEIPSQPHFTQQ